jgi:hypothetical protein
MQDPRSEQLNLAGTHLNLTAILTKLGKHKEAVTHAKASILILRKLIDRKEAQIQQKGHLFVPGHSLNKDLSGISMRIEIEKNHQEQVIPFPEDPDSKAHKT